MKTNRSKITDMETLIKEIFCDLKKDGHGESFVEYILSEATKPFEVHTQFNNLFVNTAFFMLDKNDWNAEKAFKK